MSKLLIFAVAIIPACLPEQGAANDVGSIFILLLKASSVIIGKNGVFCNAASFNPTFARIRLTLF